MIANVSKLRWCRAGVMSSRALIVCCLVVCCLHSVQATLVRNDTTLRAMLLPGNGTDANSTSSAKAVTSADGIMVDGVAQHPVSDAPEDWSTRLWSESIALHGRGASAYGEGVPLPMAYAGGAGALRSPVHMDVDFHEAVRIALRQNDLEALHHLIDMGESGYKHLQEKRAQTVAVRPPLTPSAPPRALPTNVTDEYEDDDEEEEEDGSGKRKGHKHHHKSKHGGKPKRKMGILDLAAHLPKPKGKFKLQLPSRGMHSMNINNMVKRSGMLRNSKCCACPRPNPDARWPGVGGSPIVENMGRSEYEWGTPGEGENKNPVGRKQQKKPECCPCDPPQGGMRFNAPGIPTTPAAVLRAAVDGETPWREILAFVKAQKQLHRVYAYGDALDLRAKQAHTAAERQLAERKVGEYHDLLSRAMTIEKITELLAQRAVHRYSVAGPPLMGPHDAYLDRMTDHVAASLDGDSSRFAGLQDLSAAFTSAPFSPDSDGTPPLNASHIHGDAPLYVRQHVWESTPFRASHLMDTVTALACNATKGLCSVDVGSPNAVLAHENPTLSGANLPLDSYDTTLPEEVLASFKLLSRGTAASACVQLGVVRCTMTVQEALKSNDTVAAMSIQSLMHELTGNEDTLSRIRFLKKIASQTRRKYVEAVEQGRPARELEQLENDVRAADGRFATEQEWFNRMIAVAGLPLNLMNNVDSFESLRGLHSASPAARALWEAEGDERSIEGMWGMVVRTYMGSSAAVKNSLRKTCGIAHETFLHIFHTLPSHSPVNLPFITVQCLCASVGGTRCAEGIFRAYVFSHSDVIEALKLIHGGRITGPAATFCAAVGPDKCYQRVDGGNASMDVDVFLLWNILHGKKLGISPSMPRNETVARLLEHVFQHRLDNDLRNASDVHTIRVALRKVMEGRDANTSIASLLQGLDSHILPYLPDSIGEEGDALQHELEAHMPQLGESFDSESVLAYLTHANEAIHTILAGHPDLAAPDVGPAAAQHDNATTGGGEGGKPAVPVFVPAPSSLSPEALAKLQPTLTFPFNVGTDAIPGALGHPGVRAVRMGSCVPNTDAANEYDCLDFEGTCNVLRPGLPDAVYAAYWKKVGLPAPSSPLDGGGVELPRDPAAATLAEKAMGEGGADSMAARQAAANKPPATDGLGVGDNGAGGLSNAARIAAAMNPVSGAATIDDALNAVLADPRAGGKQDLPPPDDDADLPGVFDSSGNGTANQAVITNRRECENTTDAVSGKTGKWTPQNTWLPYTFPHALTAAIRSGNYKAVKDVLTSGAAHANMLLTPEIGIKPTPCVEPTCSKWTARGVSTVMMDMFTPEGQTGTVAISRRCTGKSPSMALKNGINGSALDFVLPDDPLGFGRQTAGAFYGSAPVRVGVSDTNALPCSAAFYRPLDLVRALASGAVPMLGPCAIKGDCSGSHVANASVLKAAMANLGHIGDLLLSFGAQSAFPAPTLGVKWMLLEGEGDQSEDLTLSNDGHGVHGGASFQWWECKPRESDDLGCIAAGSAKPPGARGKAGLGGGKGACDPETGEGCSCGEGESPSSDMVCDPKTRKRRKKVTVVTTTTKKRMSSEVEKQQQVKKADGKDASAKPKRCDPNPFTNLLFFVFCIILMVIEAIMKAMAMFIETPPAHSLSASGVTFLDLGSPHAHILQPLVLSLPSVAAQCTGADNYQSCRMPIVLRPSMFAGWEHAVAAQPDVAKAFGIDMNAFTMDHYDASMTELLEVHNGFQPADDKAQDSGDMSSVQAGLDQLASESEDKMNEIAEEANAIAPSSSSPDTNKREKRPKRPKPAPGVVPPPDLDGCDCFCPRNEATGTLPLPPLTGHAMVVVDGGTTPVMIGGACIGHGGDAGDVVLGSKAYYFRVGRGNDATRIAEIADRLSKVKSADEAGAGEDENEEEEPGEVEERGEEEGEEEPDASQVQGDRKKGPWSPDLSINNPVVMLERASGQHGSGNNAVRHNRFQQQANPMKDFADDGAPQTVENTPPTGDLPADPSNVELLSATIPGLAVALQEILQDNYGAMNNVSKTGHTWFEVGQPPHGSPMQNLFGSRKSEFLVGKPMHPRSGHTAVAFSRHFGDGGDLLAFRQQLYGALEPFDLFNVDEVLWPRHFLRDQKDKLPLVGDLLDHDGAWGPLRYDWDEGKDYYRETLEKKYKGHNLLDKVKDLFGGGGKDAPPPAAPWGERETVVWRRSVAEGDDEPQPKASENDAPPSMGGIWMPVQPPLTPERVRARKNGEPEPATIWEKDSSQQQNRGINLPFGLHIGTPFGNKEEVKLPERHGSDVRGAYTASSFPSSSNAEYVGYMINATSSLFDAIVVFGGYNGNGGGASYYDDVWLLMRFASPRHTACAVASSDAYTCMTPSVSRMHMHPVPVMYRLVGGLIPTKDMLGKTKKHGKRRPRRKVKLSHDTAFVELSSASEPPSLDGLSGLDTTLDLTTVSAESLVHHMRDPLHYSWLWQWRNVGPNGEGLVKNSGARMDGAPNGYAPSPRSEHASASVAGEIMMIIGGKGPVSDSDAAAVFFDDVYAFHVPTLTWMPISLADADAQAPYSGESLGFAARSGHTATAVGPFVYIFGGYGATMSLLNDVWILDTRCQERWRHNSGDLPGYLSETSDWFGPSGRTAARNAGLYNVPLPITRTVPRCVSPDGSYVFLRDNAQAAVQFTLKIMKPLGGEPSPRFGHTALLFGNKLLFFGGYAAGASGDWREDPASAGLRMEQLSLDIPLPLLSSLSPRVLPPAGRVDMSSTGARGGARFVPARITIKGRNFGSCGRWVLVEGSPLCAATCPNDLKDPAITRCKYSDMSTWVGNNDAAVASVTVGGASCVNITWYSPFSIACSLALPLARPMDESLGAIVTMKSGLSSADSAQGMYNVRGGTIPSRVSTSLFQKKRLFRVAAPEVTATFPRGIVDHPARGPIVLVGRHFGPREAFVPPEILEKWVQFNTRSEGASSLPTRFAALPNGGVLHTDGSISFEHNQQTLEASIFSVNSGTDGRNVSAHTLPLVMWVGRRPCLRVVWYSDNLLTCECVQRNRRDDISITREEAESVLKSTSRFIATDKTGVLHAPGIQRTPSPKPKPAFLEVGEENGAQLLLELQALSMANGGDMPPEVLQREVDAPKQAVAVADGVPEVAGLIAHGIRGGTVPFPDALQPPEEKDAMMQHAEARARQLQEPFFPLDDLTDILGGDRPIRADALPDINHGESGELYDADRKARAFAAFTPPWHEGNLVVYIHGRRSKSIDFPILPPPPVPGGGAPKAAVPVANACPSMTYLLPLRGMLGALASSLDSTAPTAATKAMLSQVQSWGQAPPAAAMGQALLRGSAPGLNQRRPAPEIAEEMLRGTLSSDPLRGDAGSPHLHGLQQVVPPAAGEVPEQMAPLDGSSLLEISDKIKSSPMPCHLRIPQMEATFSLPDEYFDVMDYRSVTGHAMPGGLPEEALGAIGVGCGCKKLPHLAAAKDILTLKDIPSKCRWSLQQYGWRMGCDSLRWQMSQMCGEGRNTDAAAKVDTAKLMQTLESLSGQTQHQGIPALSSDILATVNSMFPSRNTPHTQCSSLRQHVAAKCSAYASDWLPAVTAAIAKGSKAEMRMQEPDVENNNSTNTTAAAPPAPIVTSGVATTTDGAIAYMGGINGTDPMPITVLGVSGDLPFWDAPTKTCSRGQPAGPRRGMAAVILNDGVTAVLYGGQTDGNPDAFADSMVGPLEPLTQVSINDTHIMQVIAEEEYADMELGQYGCSLTDSDETAMLRVLPMRKSRDTDELVRQVSDLVGDFD